MSELTKNYGLTKQAYTGWCRDELFAGELRQAARLLQRALDLHLLRIYRSLDLKQRLRTPTSPARLVKQLGYTDTADITLDAMLERLSNRFDFLSKRMSGGECQYEHRGAVPVHDGELEELRERMGALGADYASTLEFLQFGEDKFEYALKDDPEFLDRVLSGREPEYEELWFRATNVDPLQNVHGIMGAVAIDALFDHGDILEIGGGTGNGIRNLFSHLQEKAELSRVERYVFTDISQKFIMSTRREIRTDYPGVTCEWRFADLNVPLAEQKIPAKSVDLIYAVNAAHVAKDIVAFLRSCRDTLRPGGRVLFAERIRQTAKDMAPRELALNLSIYHRTAAIRNEDYRPMHCYLSPENWIKVFEAGGFQKGEIWPDLQALSDDFPDQYAAVVTAVA
ncbi:MAG: class I SAM-dependent methyltransferase [Woeseiaceae bacterium]